MGQESALERCGDRISYEGTAIGYDIKVLRWSRIGSSWNKGGERTIVLPRCEMKEIEQNRGCKYTKRVNRHEDKRENACDRTKNVSEKEQVERIKLR